MTLPKSLEPWISAWQARAVKDSVLTNLGRHCTIDLCLQLDDEPWFIQIEQGRFVAAHQGPFHMRRADLVFAGPRSSWEKFFSPVPPPGFHDIFAMSSYFHISVQGNHDLLREHLVFIKALLQLRRDMTTSEQG